MPKYLFAANYTQEGLEGLRREGAKSRADAIGEMTRSIGGTLEGFWLAFGDTDAYVLVDAPDDETAAAVALTVSASGAARTRTTKLLTMEQVDEAIAKEVPYRPPGG